MKKVVILLVALAVTFGSQAQLGGLVRQAVKSGVEQKLGLKNQMKQQPKELKAETTQEQTKEEDRIPTPEEVMAMVPQIPAPQHLAEYACEQNRANQRTLKLLTNPTTTFLTQMVVATASGYVVMMGGSQAGSLYNFDEQLLHDFGITKEMYDAMDEKEQQELATKYAAELQDRYLRTAERLASDEGYKTLMDKYMSIEEGIQKRYDEVDSLCRDMWQNKYGAKANPTESDMCEYFKEAVSLQYKAVLDAMKERKMRQLAVAKQIDEYVQRLAKKYPSEVYAGFYNQGGICATAYVSDAARLTSFSDPR